MSAHKDEVVDLLVREGLLLDAQQWDEWLDIYADDACYWVPAWRDDGQLVDDPAAGVSIIYHDNRTGLQERVTRLRSNKSVTAMPLPRTVHVLGYPRVLEAGSDAWEVHANGTVLVFHPRTAATRLLGLRYRVRVRKDQDGQLRIASKQTILANDRIPTMLDFYCL